MKLKRRTRRYSQLARAQSTEATGRHIVEAFLARLMTQWFDQITLDRVAQDAGVTVQTVVRRFGGKDGLLAEAVKILAVQIRAQRGNPQGDIAGIVASLFGDYENTGDAVIRLLALGPRHPALQAVLEFGRAEHRGWVATALSQPLSRLDSARRTRALDALVIVTDVYTWKLLRRDMARSETAAQAIMRSLILAALAEFSGAHINSRSGDPS